MRESLSFFSRARHQLRSRERLGMQDPFDFPWVGPTVPAQVDTGSPPKDRAFGTTDLSHGAPAPARTGGDVVGGQDHGAVMRRLVGRAADAGGWRPCRKHMRPAGGGGVALHQLRDHSQARAHVLAHRMSLAVTIGAMSARTIPSAMPEHSR
jgi:hypothetical protein